MAFQRDAEIGFTVAVHIAQDDRVAFVGKPEPQFVWVSIKPIEPIVAGQLQGRIDRKDVNVIFARRKICDDVACRPGGTAVTQLQEEEPIGIRVTRENVACLQGRRLYRRQLRH